MIEPKDLQALLGDLESSRVERTTSTKDIEKFSQAICAFANDMDGSGKPGYLVVGVKDGGDPAEDFCVTDKLLKDLSAIRDSGSILPIPTLSVEKAILSNGEVVVVEVQPSDSPPVRYRGQTWIRVGPRKSIASEQDERILVERRRSLSKTFDLRPCYDCSADNLALDLYTLSYRNQAISRDVIEANHRDLLPQMETLGLYDTKNNCATHAGVLLLATENLNWLPGAYLQFVRYDGPNVYDTIRDERQFRGDLTTLLREIDAFLKHLFPSRPVAVSTLRDEHKTPYPVWAIREFLMNAFMHRDYEYNAPIRFYWFSDRIEIQNPGGLCGSLTKELFPNQSDYRNPKIAEIMKNLGYVERFGHGILRAQKSLADNGNPLAEFDLTQRAFFLVTIRESPI